jgi:hypothetical protein
MKQRYGFSWDIDWCLGEPKDFIIVNKTEGALQTRKVTYYYSKEEVIEFTKKLTEQTTDEIVIINLKTLEIFPVKVEKKVTVKGL